MARHDDRKNDVEIGVCIPTRNQCEYIADTLDSVFVQSLLPSDVVVSDDAGTDATGEVVESFRIRLPERLRHVLRYEKSATQLGMGGNFDRGVRLARGKYVIKVDSDDILEPRFVEECVRQLEEHPHAGWAHCNVVNIQPDGLALGLAHTRKQTGYYSSCDAMEAYLRRNDTCHCVTLRKEAYLRVGGYRHEMKSGQDWLLWIEMLIDGWGYCYDCRPLAKMRRYDKSPRIELMSRRRRDFVDSVLFMNRHLDGVLAKRWSTDLDSRRKAAMRVFRSSAADLCFSACLDEVDVQVRQILMDGAFKLNPSTRNRLGRMWLPRVPARATRMLVRLWGLPRRIARAGAQQVRRVSPSCGSRCY